MPSAADTSVADQLARLLAQRRQTHERQNDTSQRVNAAWVKVRAVLPEDVTTRIAGAAQTNVVPTATAPSDVADLQNSADRLAEQHTAIAANLARANGELARINSLFETEALRRRRRRTARLGLLLILLGLVGAIWFRVWSSL